MPYTIEKVATNPNGTKHTYILRDSAENACCFGTLAECRNVKAGLESGSLKCIRVGNTTEIHWNT